MLKTLTKKVSEKKPAKEEAADVGSQTKMEVSSSVKIEETIEVKKVAPKTELEILEEEIDLKYREFKQAAKKGPDFAEPYRLEWLASKDKLSKFS